MILRAELEIWAEVWLSFELEHLRFALNLAASFKGDNKFSSLANSAFNSDRTCHLLNQTLANA